jgi:alpha-D-xyloside xylohydrolase
VEAGVEGFKLDYGEDVLAGPFSNRTPWKFADGSDERTMHSQYQRHYHATYRAVLPADGGFLLCRAGTYGDQTNGVIIWPGDLDANFAHHGERVIDPDGDYTAVGGLPASIIAGLTLGPSGFPFYGADTGGYRHSPPDNETFSRWFEQTALSTVMQIGTSANDVAWELGGPNGFDQPLLDRYRAYTRLHLRLFAYLWSYAVRLADDGRPIQRALGLAYPALGVHPNDIYLLGDHLLVAPVVERGSVKRSVYFPPGSWIHWFTGERFEGPGEQDVDAPLGRLPLFIRADGLVPLLRPTIDTLSPTIDTERVDSYATTAGVLYARAVALGSAEFELFDGTRLAQDTDAQQTVVGYAAGNEFSVGAIVELLRAPPPTAVSGAAHPTLAALEAGDAGWYYDAALQRLWVRLEPAQAATITW